MFTGVFTTDLAGGGGGSRRRSGIVTIIDLAGGGGVQQQRTGSETGRSSAICNGFRFAAPPPPPPGFSSFVWPVDDGGMDVNHYTTNSSTSGDV